MRVALELQPCCGNRSGIGTYTYELARRLKNGGAVEFSGNVFNFLNRNDNRTSLEGIDMPIHVQRSMPYGVYRRIWHYAPLTYGMLFPPADLNVFFNYIVPPSVKGKCITTIHDMTYLRYPETMDKNNLRRIVSDIQYSVERSDAIITVSEFSKREIQELLGVKEEKIRVIYNAASLPKSKTPESEVRRKFGVAGPYLLYVGNVEPRKNLRRLVQAYRRLKREKSIPHKLVCVGSNAWESQDIYQEAEGLCKSGDIIFTGYVAAEDKAALYDGADVFVFPSLYEGFGIPPLEAMCSGCPVVCANAASLPKIVGQAAELVDPLDDTDIARGIWHVLSDRDYARGLVDAGRRQAQLFNWDQSAECLMNLINETIKV